MSITRSLLCCSLLALGLSKSTVTLAQHNKSKSITTQISVLVPNTATIDSIRLFQWEGIQIKPLVTIAPSKENTEKAYHSFVFPSTKYPEGIYFIGKDLQDLKPIIIGVDKTIALRLNEEIKFQKAGLNNATNNILFLNTLDSISVLNTNFSTAIQNYAQYAGTDVLQANSFLVELKNIDQRKKSLLNNLKKQAPNVARMAALYSYLSYPNNKRSETEKEAEYFKDTYFQFANLADSTYYRMPHFFESVKLYGSTLFNLNLSDEDIKNSYNNFLSKIPATAPHYKVALLGLAFSALGKNNAIFSTYATIYKDKFTGYSPEIDPYIAQEIVKARGPLMPGTEAPDFSELTPDGKELKLSDLRGKIVLVDFWASWCGPCRRENPHVVKLYQKYKDKGFEVLGVSLDNSRERWLKAIEDDKLTWPHVSDLQGWQAKAAKLYGVTGIPFTLLLDKNGKIIAKSLRGDALDQELQRIFGF